METATQAMTPAMPQQQPVQYVRALQSVPTTQLLHFSVIMHIIGGALFTLIYGCVALGLLGTRDGAGAAAACLFVALLIGGGSLWWWIYCLKLCAICGSTPTNCFTTHFKAGAKQWTCFREAIH